MAKEMAEKREAPDSPHKEAIPLEALMAVIAMIFLVAAMVLPTNPEWTIKILLGALTVLMLLTASLNEH